MKLEVVSGWNYTDYDAFLAGQAYPYDADALYAALTTNGSGNSLGYSNQKVDELLEQPDMKQTPIREKSCMENLKKHFHRNRVLF